VNVALARGYGASRVVHSIVQCTSTLRAGTLHNLLRGLTPPDGIIVRCLLALGWNTNPVAIRLVTAAQIENLLEDFAG
jgi:hypothetical protein